MKFVRVVGVMAALCSLFACVPRREVPPAAPPPPTTQPVTPPAPAATVPPPVVEWIDAPAATGAWFYQSDAEGPRALFGVPNSEGIFIVRCDPAARTITLSREGVGSGDRLTIRTTSLTRSLPASARNDPLPAITATLPAQDPLLDAIAFSRGRFAVEAAGAERLVLPAWAEPARVIEDCRG